MKLSYTHIKVFVFTAILSVSGQHTIAQPFGNEWIDLNQTYFKIRLADDGIYRISQLRLINAGVPLSSLDPRRMQIFYRGVEQAILIEGQQDGSFDSGDFIEFYGQRNNGGNETSLYTEPAAQPHTRYSLFSDSSSYFLTWKLSPDNGKRISIFSENNVDNIPKEDYHYEENLHLNVNKYSGGKTYSGGNVLLSQFDHGEGWTGSDIPKGNVGTFTLTDINNAFTSGPNPNLEIHLVGRNNLAHNVDILVGPSPTNLRLIGNASFIAHDNFRFLSDILWSDISASGELVVQVSVLGVGTNADRAAVSFIALNYAEVPDMNTSNSKKFTLESNPANKSFLEVINSPGGIRLYDITDPSNLIQIGMNQSATTFDAIIPSTSTSRKLYAYNTAQSSFDIQPVSFQNINPSDFNYLIISHKDLMKETSSGLPNPVNAYKEYRESQEGGEHSVLVAEITSVYDQFNYGESSPLAIRNLVNYLLTSGQLGYVFIIGEALDVPNKPDRTTKEVLASNDLAHYVPTMGLPGSDVALLAGLNGSEFDSPIPIGRITATTPDQVQDYLNKVIEYDQAPFDDIWRKRIIHLSGGTTPQELAVFRSNLDGFKAIAESDFLGGDVTTIGKQSSNPIELFNVSEAINNGTGLLTFFGHSGPNGSDVDVGRVSNPNFGYDNQGLYTSIIVNGCNAGDVFGTFPSLGEDWILTANKGAISYMAHSDNGLSTQLRRYTDEIYSVGYGDSTFIGQSIGEIKKEAAKRYLEKHGTSQAQIAQVQQFILQGDPAVKLFGADKPDYALNSTDISISSFDGTPITALTDSFAVDIIIKNYGITENTPLNVTVNRFLNNGSMETFGPKEFDPVSSEDTVSMAVKTVANQEGFGNNRFEVILDEIDTIAELSELNNRASIDFFISSGTTVNLFPRNFGIEPESKVRFLTQASDLISDKRGFILEIDTSRNFNSPILLQQSGEFRVLAEWDIDLPVTGNDTIVYYWRTKFSEVLPGEQDEFAMSSFSFMPGSPDGWAQSTFDQFDLLETIGLFKNEITKKWQFLETQIPSVVETHGINTFSDPVVYDSLSLTLDNVEYLVQTRAPLICRSNAINAVAFDQSSLFTYIVFGINSSGRSGEICGRTPFIINNITNAEISGTSLKLNTYIDAVNDGDYILLFSIGQLDYETWPPEVMNKLNTIGVSTGFLNGLATGQPVIILGRKGTSPGTAIAISGLDDEAIKLDDNIIGRFTSGSIKTPRIGPASSWKEFFNEAKFSETPVTDVFSYDILGIDRNGVENIIFDDVTSTTQDLSGVDANQFPFLRMLFNTSDDTNLTTADLNKWQITFEGLADGILLTDDEKVKRGNTVDRMEGENFETSFYFKNISNLNFTDSIPVFMSVFNVDQRENVVDSINLKPIQSGDSAIFDFTAKTFGRLGLNDINVFANPNRIPEVTINNNIIDINDLIQVNSDQTNPVLDVTFDGVYILDGDIVSPSPRILMLIKDDNPFLFKTDTTGISISLRHPCDNCDFERVSFSNPNIVLTEATEDEDFKIEYNPNNLSDGIYGLRVQAADASGNLSGVQPYEITFQVINESTITHFYPYPNPFSTSTRFAFTLTGSEIPDQIKIQIMTVSGKIVREITQDELGALHIGNNLSDYAWDGRDEFGDQLANGVYLYRVILRKNGERMERRLTSADRAFKHGFGKIYLLR